MLIREMTRDDWPAVWPLLRSVAAAGETYTWPPDVGEEQARGMWLLAPPGHTVVAVDDAGNVLGTAKVLPNQSGPGAHVANAGFIVDSASAGRGVGRALGGYVLDWSRAAGYRAMQFNAVVETNTRAVALWKSLGFEIVGTAPEAFLHPAHGYVGLHIMYRLL